MLHTSTSEVYGTARYVPIDEAHPLQGQSPYSASKIGADQIALSFYSSFGLPVSVIRPFNTFGPRQSARAFIPTVISQIAAGFETIKLGSLYPTRDFTFVKDMADAFIAVAESEDAVGEVINAGSNFEISMENTVKMIAEIMCVSVHISEDEQRIRPSNSEVARLWADIGKVRRLTHWQPSYANISGFKRGLQETIAWYQKNENRKLFKATVYNV